MKKLKTKKQKKIIIPTENDPLYKLQKCDWCDRKNVMTKRFISEYFKGYYCECCCELAEMANAAAERDD